MLLVRVVGSVALAVLLVGCGQTGPLKQRSEAPQVIKAAGIEGLTAYSLSGEG